MKSDTRRYLLLDSGNTRLKAAWANSTGALLHTFVTSQDELKHLLMENNDIRAVAVSDVSKALSSFDFPSDIPVLRVNSSVRLPFTSNYQTPETLGADRIALLAGGYYLGLKGHKLIVDAGTCLTADVLDESGIYCGGIISPGLSMRLRAMHQNTGSLPLLEPQEPEYLAGQSTRESMLSGAINGLRLETEGWISAWRAQYPGLIPVITGGNGAFLAKNLALEIFAAPDLLYSGLYHLLKLNGF